MKITIFGAAFDPPHWGHFKISLSLLEKNITDQVWLLPVKYHEFGKDMSSDQDRLAMLSLMVEELKSELKNMGLGDSKKVKIATYELDQNQPSYTYQTLCDLRDQYPEHQFSFAIGADNLERFDEWDHYQEMVREFQFYVYPRSGYSLVKLLPEMKVLEGVTEVDVASTQVRQAIKSGKPVRNLVLPAVEEYIKSNQLYLD